MTSPCVSRKETAISFLRLASSGKVHEAYERHVSPGFRHHNPHFKCDASSLMSAMIESAARFPDKVFEVKRALEDGDLVAVHARVRMNAGKIDVALIHIFRFEGDRIAELWEVGQPVPESSPNELGIF